VEKREEFTTAMKNAMKDKNQTTLSTIRLIMAALKDKDIAARAQGKADGINEQEILSMLQSMIKQRHESAKMYCDAGREELAEREEAEIEVIEQFLPKQLGESEVQGIIAELITEMDAKEIKDMGKVMGALKERYAGQLDMSKASGAVKAALAA